MKFIKSNKNKKYKTGFTLVEVLVATTIFSIVALAAIAIISAANASYKRISSNRIAMDNVNIAITTISNEIKFGNTYRCVNTNDNYKDNNNYNNFSDSYSLSSSLSCNALAFIPEGEINKRIVYYFNTASSSINEIDYKESSGSYILERDQALTSSSFKVNRFSFDDISGNDTNDYLQPKLNLFISGMVELSDDSTKNVSTTSVAIQTTIAQRVLDN